MRRQLFLTGLLLILPPAIHVAPAQVVVGASVLQSLVIPTGSVSLPGNPSILSNEITGISASDGAAGGRCLFNAESLSLLIGDQNGDGLPYDWPDVDAMDLRPPVSGSLATQPNIFNARFSFRTSVFGPVTVTPGDVVSINPAGGLSIAIPRGSFQAALGTTAALDVTGFAELPDGSVLVSFGNFANGNNIVNPLSGTAGTVVPFGPADVFIIRQPFGALPALFAYRQPELAVVVTFYYGSWPNPAIGGIDDQTVFPAGVAVPALNNPNDPLNLYQGGTRPRLLWTIAGDDNVFCWTASLNPRGAGTNFFALVGNGSTSAAGYSTSGGSGRVFVDALSVIPTVLGNDSRLTLDASNLVPTGGSTVTLTARGPTVTGRTFQLGISTTLLGTPLSVLPAGFGHVLLNPSDPFLLWSLTPPQNVAFRTGAVNAQGSANSASLTIPAFFSGNEIHVQGYAEQGNTPLTTPLTLVVN